jgi:hypothetical protein
MLVGVGDGVGSPYVGVLPFGAVARLAVAVALALRDIDLGARRLACSAWSGRSASCSSSILGISPGALSLFGLGVQKFPESFSRRRHELLAVGTLNWSGSSFFATLERARDDAPVFDPKEYLGWFATVRDLWNGNLLFALLVFEAAAFGFFAFDLLGRHIVALERFVTRSEFWRPLASFGFVVIPVALAIPIVVMIRDSSPARHARKSPLSLGLIPVAARSAFLVVALFGAALSPSTIRRSPSSCRLKRATRLTGASRQSRSAHRSGRLAPYYADAAVSFRGPEEAY